MKIKTEHVYPAIPIRQFDWCAYDDDTYEPSDGEVPGGIIGQGATEQDAIADFKEQWEQEHGPIEALEENNL